MFYISVKFDNSHLSGFKIMTPDSDLYLGHGNLDLVYDTPSQYVLFYMKFNQVCFNS